MRRTPRIVLASLAALLALGCSGDEPTPAFATFEEACAALPGCGETRFPSSGGVETVYRIRVVRDPGSAPRIDGIERIDVARDVGVPVGPSEGAFVLAGRNASGEPLDGQAIAFPTVFLAEGESEGEVVHEEVSLETQTVDHIAFVRAVPGLTDFAVLDADGAVVDQAPLPAAGSDEVGRSSEALVAGSSAACQHVMLLEGPQDREYASNFPWLASGATLVTPGPTQRAVVAQALGLMPPLLCHGIARIAFVAYPSNATTRGGNAAFGGAGDLIAINISAKDNRVGVPHDLVFDETNLSRSARARAELVRALLHEAGHAVATLLGPGEGIASAGTWTPPARPLAETALRNMRMTRGLTREWNRMHDNFVDLEWADDYELADARRMWDADRVTRAGAMSRYGTTAVGDDFCEFIAHPIAAPLFRDAGAPPQDFACETFRAYTAGGLPGRYSAAYTKLRFVRDLGLVSDEDFEACVGTGITWRELPTPGFETTQGDSRRTFSLDEGGLYEVSYEDGAIHRFQFEMTGSGTVEFGGENQRADITLSLPVGSTIESTRQTISWPRGVYRIGLGRFATIQVDVPDEPAASFEVTDGYVLVVHGSNDHVEGSAVVHEGFRYGAPFPVPQVFDPPLTIRFLYR